MRMPDLKVKIIAGFNGTRKTREEDANKYDRNLVKALDVRYMKKYGLKKNETYPASYIRDIVLKESEKI